MSSKVPLGARRKAPRLTIELEGSLVGRLARPVTVVDLSLTGCLVRCEGPLERGAILDLQVRLGPSPLAGKVRVAESSLDGTAPPDSPTRYLAGLEFLGLPAREQVRLRQFLEEERKRRRDADAAAH